MPEIPLSRLEKRILKEVVRAYGRRLTMEELATASNTTVEKVYRCLERPEFRQLFVESMQVSLVADTPSILNKFAELAKAGQFNHGKLILEIAGVYTEKQKLEAEIRTFDSPFKTDEERERFIEALIQRRAEEKAEEPEESGGHTEED